MRILLIILSFLGAHFSLTATVRADAGKSNLIWPFAKDTKPALALLQNPMGETIIQLLAIIAALSFIAALFGVFGKYVPAEWLPSLLIIGSISSILLYLMHFNLLLIIPLILNLFILLSILLKTGFLIKN